MKNIVIILIVLVFATGCAMSQNLAHPDGRKVKCQAYYYGVIGVIMASRMVVDCINVHEEQGFKQVKR
jgi:hypothetical protein